MTRHPCYRYLNMLIVIAMLLAALPLPAEAASAQQPTDPATGALTDGATGELIAAAGVLPSNIFDPNEVDWASIRGLSSSAFTAHFNQMKGEYMMLDIEVDEIEGEQKVSAVWQRNVDGRGWVELRNLSSDEFHTKWTELKDSGYRLVDQEAYTLGGIWYYAGIWVENKENLAWASYRNLTTEEFSQRFAEFKNAGYLMVDVEGYSTANGLRYSMIWVKNVENLDWVEWRNLSSEEFGQKFDELKGKYRMWDVESYRHNGVQYYAGIWVENKNGRGWVEYRDMTANDYRNRWYRLRDQGYRLIDFNIYPTAAGTRYAGIWRQNSDRPDWALRTGVDDLVQSHLDSFSVPGLSVAIAIGDEIKYMRGFGFQDVNSDTWYSAHTLNRLASVAKAVASVLTLRLWQNGVLANLDALSDTLLPALPNHHTHTVRQLLANRSGIGHYEDYNVTEQQYNTALAAAQNFWNTDSNAGQAGTQLVYTPGTNCKYSTHASTVLGAVLEGVTGTTIGQLVEDQLSAPFGLSTLQVENRGDGDDNRSSLYDQNNNEAAADNTSWKVLGGGLEASAYDLVRFGMKSLDGTIINANSLAEMQLVPAPTPCTDPDWGNMSNYALGWSVSTQLGSSFLSKGGNQLGSNTTIRLYPDKEMVIVVLANRNENHSTGTLAGQIGTLLLSDENAAGLNDQAGYSFSGFQQTVTGNVQAFFNQQKQLVVSGFDARGGGGIVTELADNTKLWESEVDLHFDMQNERPLQTSFRAFGTDDALGHTLDLQATAQGLRLTPTFASPNFQIQYLLDDQILQSNEGSRGDGQSAAVNWDEIWCIMALPQGLPTELCHIWISYHQNQSGNAEWNLRLAQPISMKDVTGKSLQFNRVRLVELPAVEASAVAPLNFNRLEISATNLEMLTIQTMRSGGPSDLPPLPHASLDQILFLPLVAR